MVWAISNPINTIYINLYIYNKYNTCLTGAHGVPAGGQE